MPTRKKVAVAIVAMLVLLGIGVGIFAWRSLMNPPKPDDTTEQGNTQPGGAGDLTEQHWDAEKQVTVIGEPSSNEEQSETVTETDTGGEHLTNDDGGEYMVYQRTQKEGLFTTNPDYIKSHGSQSESDIRDSTALKGEVSYDDIPNASTIDGGYGSDTLKNVLVRYVEDSYPTETIKDIQLMGNVSAASQETGQPTSCANYLVTLSKGQRIGLSVTCSESVEPYVLETNYLVVNPGMLYNVAEDEYIPMTITEHIAH